MCQKLIAVLKQHKRLVAKLNKTIIKLYPETEELTIMPSSEEQTKEGLFSKVTVAGDSNLLAENIKEGVSIFGIKGTGEMSSAKITDASYLFYEGARLDYINEILELLADVTNTSYMFIKCSQLQTLELSNFDTSNVTNMRSMFSSCGNLTSIDVSNFNTSNVTSMYQMFNSCSKLQTLDLSNFNTSNVTDMETMFYKCTNLRTINLSNFNTSNVTSMKSMFDSNYNLTDLDLNNFDMSKIIKVENIFNSCQKLTNLKSFKNLGKGYTKNSANYSYYKLDLSSCTALTYESLIDVITNGLYDLNLTYDVANGGTLYRQSLILGKTNLAKLTEEEIAIATEKGWDVS